MQLWLFSVSKIENIELIAEADMSYRDQKKYLEYLHRYEKKFNREESEAFKMFLKMDKDEEDFDSVSMGKLKDLYEKYYTPVDKSKYDAFFKKKDEDNAE
jgi:hypothetical protein